MTDEKSNPRLWTIVMILTALISCIGTVFAAFIPQLIQRPAILPTNTVEVLNFSALRNETSTPSNSQSVMTPQITPKTSTVVPIPASTSDPTTLLLNHFKDLGFVYNWVGGNAQSKRANVTDIEVNGNNITIKYDWKNGSLHGILINNTLRGEWRQDGNGGEFEFIFTSDFSSATGWWSDKGSSVKYNHFLN
jgi:hypothetical protein